MAYNIPDRVVSDILAFARKHGICRVILFGSCPFKIDELLLLIRDSFIPAFISLQETLREKLLESEREAD